MYRLWSRRAIAKLHGRRCCFSLQRTATNGRYPLDKRTVSFEKTDLQTRVLQWDEKLSIPDLPPMRSLVDHLVRRRTPSCSKGFKVGLNNLLVRSACRVLGLQDAHERLCKLHSDDPVHNCWYAPSNHGDTFGIRHDEAYFHEDIIPTQPVTSYAVLIRGSPEDAGTSVDGGIGERITANDVSSRNHEDVMINRATSLIHGLMKARDFYKSSEFAQDAIKTTALSMQWYNYIFSCSMQFRPGSIERYKACDTHSRHIVVMVRGNMYKLDMMIDSDEEGEEKTITSSQLKKRLKDIIEMDVLEKQSTPMAVLTTLTSSERCHEEQRLKCLSQRNVANLSLIRDALFVVALDPDDSPRTANEAMFALHSGNFVNRWYDKSMQLVVFGNGVAGFVNNYLAGMTGTVGTNFVRIAVGSEGLLGEQTRNGTDHVTSWPKACPLSWDDTTDEYFKQKTASIIDSSRTSGPFKPFSEDVFRICAGFSFEAMCKTHDVTPGAAFQAGMQLALARIAGRCTSVNEIVSIRHFRFGGMTFMDGSMADMKQFVNKARISQHNLQGMTKQERVMLRALLKKVVKSYKDEVLRYKKGEISLWHLDALYRNMGLANRLPFAKPPQFKLKRMFGKAVVDFLGSPLLNILPSQIAENVTSNPCWHPEIEAIGRPGVKCILPPTSMALHYMFGRDAISITVNANPEHPCYKNEKEFVKVLEQSLELVKDLLDLDTE